MSKVETALIKDIEKYLIEESFSPMDIREVRRFVSFYNYSPEIKQKLIAFLHDISLDIKVKDND